MTVLKTVIVSFFFFIMLFIWDEGVFTIWQLLVVLFLPTFILVGYKKRKIITDLFGEVQK